MSPKTGTGKIDRIKSNWWAALQEYGEEVLRRQRKQELGLTLKKMAQRIGISASAISRVERGLATPKDRPTAQAYIYSYELNQEQADAWLKLLYGIHSDAPLLSPALQITFDPGMQATFVQGVNALYPFLESRVGFTQKSGE